MNGISIIATGSALPEKVVKNADIAETAGTTDEWIVERTGIHQRYYCGKEESNTVLAIRAASEALEKSGLEKGSIGLCIAATMTPDFATPSTACTVQKELDLSENMAAFDLNAACSGFLYALDVARAYMYMNDIDYALIIGTEKFSDLLDMNDYGTAILFGDAAGAVIIKKSESMYYSIMGSRGSDVIWMKGPGSENSVLHMQGRAVFRFATNIIEKSVKEILEKAGLTIDDVDHFLFHQANERIIDFVVKRMKLPMEKVYKNMDRMGNTSAASIPALLDEVVKSGSVKKGDKVLSVGFGGGLTWAAILIEW